MCTINSIEDVLPAFDKDVFIIYMHNNIVGVCSACLSVVKGELVWQVDNDIEYLDPDEVFEWMEFPDRWKKHITTNERKKEHKIHKERLAEIDDRQRQ